MGVPVSLDDKQALSNFIDAMKDAEEAARAMAYTREQSSWLLIAEQVSAVRGLATRMAAESVLLLPGRYRA